MNELPDPIFATKDCCYAEGHPIYILPAANSGVKPLYLYDVAQVMH